MKVIYEKKTDDLYHWDGMKAQLKCSAHLHYHVEIVYMRSGSATAYIDSNVFEVNSGDLLIVFPNRIHRFEDRQSGNQYDLFIVNPDIVPELSQRISAENPQNPIIQNVAKNERLLSLIKILSDVKNFPPAYRETLIKGYFLAFFSEVLDMLPMRSNKPDENQAMRTVIQYCSQNFTKDLSLTILEEELHLNKYYISHLFGDKLGMRFNDYINSLRISESCRLLRMSALNITEISDASGFGTLRTFNRAFIKQMGMSPSEYRKSGRMDNNISVLVPTVQYAEGGEAAVEKVDTSEKDDLYDCAETCSVDDRCDGALWGYSINLGDSESCAVSQDG